MPAVLGAALGWPGTAGAAPQVLTVAGTGVAGSSGLGGPATSARLDQPAGIALDGAGDVFVADTDNCRVEEVPAAAGTHYGVAMVAHRLYTVAGTTCTATHAIGYPTGVAVDAAGDLFVADATGDRVLELGAGHGSRLHTVAGTGSPGSAGEGGPAGTAHLDDPTGLAVDPAGDLFIADTENCRVEEVPAAAGTHYGVAMTAGRLYTVAGTGTCGMTGLGGPAGAAELSNPTAVAVDAHGDLLIADRGTGTVVELAAVAGDDYGTTVGAGDLAVVAGLGTYASYLDDGFAATGYAAEVNFPYGLAVAANGDLYLTDSEERVVRVVPAVSGTLFGRQMSAGDLYTVVGALPTGTGDDKTKWVTANVTTPYGIAVDAKGDVYFSDRGADEVREVRP
jgi:sugar lactone lactonase YvrE